MQISLERILSLGRIQIFFYMNIINRVQKAAAAGMGAERSMDHSVYVDRRKEGILERILEG